MGNFGSGASGPKVKFSSQMDKKWSNIKTILVIINESSDRINSLTKTSLTKGTQDGD